MAAGWAGCMALPRLLSLNSEGELEMTVAREAQSLRGKTFTLLHENPNSGERLKALPPIIALDDPRVELTWNASPTALKFVLEDKISPWWSASIKPHGANASLLNINGSEIEIPASTNQQHEFHLYLDASVAELIVNRRHAITSRIYRKPDGPLYLRFSDTHDAALTPVKISQLQPISSNRLTT
jgi:beta-fructofuranosidase